jgi:mono/diheme cytochrome c family protein
MNTLIDNNITSEIALIPVTESKRRLTSPVLLFLTIICFAGSCSPSFAQIDTTHGASLIQRCSGCHKLDVQLVGPALGPQITEETDDQYLVRWIHNSQALIAAGEPRAVGIYNRYNQSIMPAFNELSAKDIADILGYVRAKWTDLQTSAKPPSNVRPADESTSSDTKTKLLMIAMVCLIFLCLIVVLLLNNVIRLTERIICGRSTKQVLK